MGLLKNDSAKVSASEVENACTVLGIDVPEKKTPATLVKLLRDHFAKKLEGVPKEDWIVCSVCGEHTDDDDRLFCCPFCGDRGTELSEEIEVPEDESPAEEPKPVEKPKAKPVSAKAPKDKSVKIEALKSKAPEVEESGEHPVVVADTEAEHARSLSSKLAKIKATIEKCKRDVARNGYEMGVALKRIQDEELWKVEGYYNFTKFLTSLEISRPFAYNLIALVENYTFAEFEESGYSRLKLSASNPVDEDDQKEDREPREKSKVPKEEAHESKDGVTLVVKVGGKPVTYPFLSRQTREPLKQWEAESFVEVPITEDVSMLMGLTTNAKGKPAGATVVFKRAVVTADAKKEVAPAKAKTAPKKAEESQKKSNGKAHHEGGLKAGKLVCGVCGRPGHNKRTCPENETVPYHD